MTDDNNSAAAKADRRAKRRAAAEEARDHMYHSVMQEWRAKRAVYNAQRATLTVPSEAEVPTLTLSQELYREALVLCLDMARHAPSDRDRARAIKLIFDLRLGEARLIAEMRGDLKHALPAGQQPAAIGVSTGDKNVLTDEQAEEVLASRRHFLAKVANEGT